MLERASGGADRWRGSSLFTVHCLLFTLFSVTMPRSLIYAANWKMHHGPAAARDFAARILELTRPVEGRALWFFPPAVSIGTLVEACRHRADIRVGAQNVHWEPKGAFTGELSLSLVTEVGATLTLVGHSERQAPLWRDQ